MDSCPFRDDISDIGDIKKVVDATGKQVNDIFNRLFVQNGGNAGNDCLAVQIQKNTEYREDNEDENKSERRNKWRRRAFFLSVIGLIITNTFILIKMFTF